MRKNTRFVVIPGWILPFLTILLESGGQGAYAAGEGKAIFEQKCAVCHTIGGGKKVGPDLKGVTERRDIPWLKGFIQSPSSYFSKNDETATALLKEYGVPMPDLGLKENEVRDVITYLKDPQLQVAGSTTTPSRYIPTIAMGAGGIIVLTLAGLVAGRKKVEVRE